MSKIISFTDGQGAINEIDAKQLEGMTIPQFLNIEGRIHNVRRDRVYDTVIYDTNTTVTAAAKRTLFRKGLDQGDTTAVSGTAFKKTLSHTNMLKDGEFEKNDLVIVRNVEIELPAFGGKPTTQANGVITNAKATFPATYDPALAAYAWLSQLWVEFKRGGKTVYENLAINFPQDAGLYAAFGANSGAYVQNGNGANLMPNVQVLEGGDDFSVVLTPLADFDLTTATGLNMEWKTKVVLDVQRVVTLYS
jgi:hypothetical protein